MKIERVTISNFRCFGPDPVTIQFREDVTAIVGNNGSGKTAIFAALTKLFGISPSIRALRKSDFHVPINSTGPASGAALFIDCVLGFPELGAEDEGEDSATVPEVFTHMATGDENSPLKVRIRLQATWTDDTTPDGTVEDEVRWITALDDEFTWEECRRVQAVERNYIQLVYVPANRNAFDQVTSLLKGRLWRAARWSNALSQIALKGATDIQKQFDAELPAKFISERLEKRWSEVHQGDTDSKPLLRLVEHETEQLVRRAEFVFFPDEAAQARRLDDLSDGQRSLFHIALTAATLEMERDALAQEPADSVFDQEKLRRTYLTILAIEEPENSLSPFFLSRIMMQARDLGRLDGAQVVISSHSASVLSRVEPEEVRYARMKAKTRQSGVRALALPEAGSDASKYVRLAVKAFPELYFARFVVLAEGDSEAIVLPRLAEAMKFPLDRSFVPIVPLGGRFVSHFWRLLADLNIPYATLLDLDAGRKHGGAGAIAYVVQELADIGNTLDENPFVLSGDIDVDDVDEIDDQELVDEDQAHVWLKALREEGVFFSSPIDLDFSMLLCFGQTYQIKNEGGTGPRTGAQALADKKAVTLKTGGTPDLYDDRWDDDFLWYPYLFISNSKPEIHLAALSKIEDDELASNAPPELLKLVKYVRKSVLG